MRALLLIASSFAMTLHAEPPGVSHIFPAGGQRGTTVNVRIGGFYFHGHAEFVMNGGKIEAPREVREVETFWIEGPMITKPASQKGEDYPRDHAVVLKIASDAPPGVRYWHCRTSQGSTPTMRFIVGELPEIVEHEIDGAPIPQQVKWPLTVNGRIFPREDVDLWTFYVEKGQRVECALVSRGLGLPLDGLMEVRGPDGHVLPNVKRATDAARDPKLSFTSAATGLHTLKLCDAGFDGGPHFVYRLTIQAEKAAKAVSDEKPGLVSLPGEFGGVIAKPGESDVWSVMLKKGETLALDLSAAQNGSRLDSVIVLGNAQGAELTRNDDRNESSPDSRLRFTAKHDGEYRITISDRFVTRGGSDFHYRVKAALVEADDFELTLASDVVNVNRQTDAEAVDPESGKKPPAKGSTLKVNVLPIGNFAAEVKLSVVGLPAGVTHDKDTIGAKQKSTDLRFIALPHTKAQVAEIVIKGTAKIGEREIVRTAVFPMLAGEEAVTQVRLGIAPPVPFHHEADYWVTNDQPAGTTMSKTFQLVRDHFDGPITVSLADRQGRCLQGLTARPMIIPAGAREFTYNVLFPPELELGRTNRVQLMLVAEITDFDGSRHTVSHTSFEQNVQMITVVSEGMMKLMPANESYAAVPESEVSVPFTLRRDPRIAQRPVRVSLQVPPHIQGVSAKPVDAASGRIVLRFGKTPGPFNMPVTLLAETSDQNDPPHAAMTKIELVTPSAAE
ncbi:MAG: PPC domain-containing protein [Prosthecobacter sp.]